MGKIAINRLSQNNSFKYRYSIVIFNLSFILRNDKIISDKRKMKMQTIYLFNIALLLTMAGCSSNSVKPAKKPTGGGTTSTVTLHMVDGNATQKTKALYSELWKVESNGQIMFGHQDDLLYGRNWLLQDGRSDIKDVCGSYPAVFGVNFAPVMDGKSLDYNDPNNVYLRKTILEAYSRGMVILACAHLNNPVTGGTAWDNSDTTVVSQILKSGSSVNIKFKGWLDNLANFLNNLKDANGNLIPVIFRPYHEYNHTWAWWSESDCSASEFVDLWRFTVDYLKDTDNVHNVIYAVSPQFDGPTSAQSMLVRWPGDNYVDFIGLDIYNGANVTAFATDVQDLETLSKEKNKPVGVTETGVQGLVKSGGTPYNDYWTTGILNPIIGAKISMVVVWRNKYDPSHQGDEFYAPFKGQSSSPDFVTFYKSSITLFSNNLPDMYKMADGVNVE